MLYEIAIENVALIDKLRLELGRGLNVLTGETGAGKSIIVDALTMVLGARADKSLVRSGKDKARVEAVFDVSKNSQAMSMLEEMGLEAEDGICTVAREVSSEGRGLCRVCGSVVQLAFLKNLASVMVELHGQNEHQQLSDPAKHLFFLDAFAGGEHQKLLKEVADVYEEYSSVKRDAQNAKKDMDSREQLREALSFQLEEIDAVKPKHGEMDVLEKKDALYRDSGKIAGSIEKAYELVYRGSGRNPSVMEQLKKASDSLNQIADLDERFDKLKTKIDDVYYLAEDAGYDLQALNESIEFDPREADRISQRLMELKRITRKYGPELDDVIIKRDELKARLEELDRSEEALSSLNERLKKADANLRVVCRALTEKRTEAGALLSERIVAELGELGMKNSRFKVDISDCARGSRGGDKVEFMLSANPGEPLKPLSSVASGGELSRIMLALKTVEAEITGVDSMVFDEIDTGISGRMAQIVGEKMALIAKNKQVICVTHLPQIAALADRQYLVKKLSTENKTGSTVKLLDDDGRVNVLAQMISGAGIEESSLLHARNMLSSAQVLVSEMKKN